MPQKISNASPHMTALSPRPDVYQRPPVLSGYTYTPDKARAARDANKLLAIRVETNRSCNLECRYCYAQSGREYDQEVPYDLLTRVISDARQLGAESIVVIGGGEPLLYSRFMDIIAYIDSLGMIPVVFSNTIGITKRIARYLYEHNVSVMGKLDSLRAGLQDYLAGQPGAARKIRQGLDNLMEAGYSDMSDRRRLRLGISFVSSKLNTGELEEIWHFCRQNSIFPNMEVLTPTGRAKDELGYCSLTAKEIQDYKLRLLEIDRARYGYDWLPHTPLAASGCLQHLYSLYITIDGNVRPCAPTKFDEHEMFREDGKYRYNICSMGLEEIYRSNLFSYVRNIDHHLKGKCSNCKYLTECIGCRGYAYSVGVNEGRNPYDALRGECLQCFREESA